MRKGEGPLLVAAYTSTGRGECIVFSNDRGRTWTEFAGNPVVKHTGRDPRLLWHAGRKRWVMAVYDETRGKRWIAFYSSPDLKKWQFESRIEGFFECPDLFELPVEGERGKTKWVLSAADGKYLLGDFDGRSFPTESGKQQLWYGNFYAAQTFSDAPDGRRIQIGWGQGITFPGHAVQPADGHSLPPDAATNGRRRADVRRAGAGGRALHGEKHAWSATTVKPGDNPLANLRGDLFDIRAELDIKEATSFGFNIRGVPVVYDVKTAIAYLQARDGSAAADRWQDAFAAARRSRLDRNLRQRWPRGLVGRRHPR